MLYRCEILLALVIPFLHISFTKKVKYDYYVYAQQWPESVCVQALHTKQHKCSISNSTESWTVHGLWPSDFDDPMKPINCESSAKFNVTLLEKIMPDLEARWPNLYTDEKLTSFWSHEWYKHGTCALAAGAVKNELDYFTKALDINKQLDIFNNLKKLNVPPLETRSYLYDDFVGALQKIIGNKTVYLQCYHPRHQSGTDVLQIQICLDLNFKPMDCKVEHHSNCQAFPVNYPPIHHPY